MNQKLLAGIGNVYADELLFQAGIHPESTVSKFSEEDLKIIYNKMYYVLETAIDKKADRNELPDNWLLLHRKAGQNCPLCGGEIEKSTVAGRGSYFCPQHQRLIS
jgi:formamidopyrimidine-DNA glycosylase